MAAITVLIALCYGNTLHAPFLFDDYDNIVQNGYVRIDALSYKALADAAFKSPSSSRPVANLSFALNYLVHGYRLPGWHIVNIAIHTVTALLLFWILRDTFSIFFKARGNGVTAAACISTLLWALNPLDTQSVTYIVQRMNSMAAMFYMLALLSYIRARLSPVAKGRFFWGILGLGAGILALGSKEVSVTLPVAIFLYEWFFFQDLDAGWFRKKLPLIAVAVVLAVGGIYLKGWFSTILNYSARDFTLAERLLTETRVVWLYLGLILLPWPGFLNLDYDYQVSTGILQPPVTLVAIVGLVILAAAIFLLAGRNRFAAFAGAWFLLNLVIESSIIPLELVYEHRTYLPSMFLWPALVAVAMGLSGRRKMAAALAGILVTVTFAVWTSQRNYTWSDEVRLNRDIVKKSPRDARTRTNLGRALIYSGDSGDAEQGLVELNTAISLDPTYPFSYLNRGGYYLDRKMYDSAIKDFQTVLSLMPNYTKAWYFLCKAYFGKRDYQAVIGVARRALAVPAFYREVLEYLAVASSLTGDLQTAVTCYRELLGTAPKDARLHFNLGRVLEKGGQRQAALGEYEKALSLAASEADRKRIYRAIATVRKEI